MRWREGRRSENVEDVRGAGGGFRRGGGGLRLGGGGLILLLVGAWLFGADPMTLLSILVDGGGGSSMQVPDASMEGGAPAPAASDEGAQFVSVVLADTEDTWTEIFQSGGERYGRRLVLFTRRGALRMRLRASRRWGPSTARPTRRSTSTSASTASCASASARPATSRRRT